MASEFGKSQRGHQVYSYAQRVSWGFMHGITKVQVPHNSCKQLYPVVKLLLSVAEIINLILYLLPEGLYFYGSTALG